MSNISKEAIAKTLSGCDKYLVEAIGTPKLALKISPSVYVKICQQVRELDALLTECEEVLSYYDTYCIADKAAAKKLGVHCKLDNTMATDMLTKIKQARGEK